MRLRSLSRQRSPIVLFPFFATVSPKRKPHIAARLKSSALGGETDQIVARWSCKLLCAIPGDDVGLMMGQLATTAWMWQQAAHQACLQTGKRPRRATGEHDIVANRRRDRRMPVHRPLRPGQADARIRADSRLPALGQVLLADRLFGRWRPAGGAAIAHEVVTVDFEFIAKAPNN